MKRPILWAVGTLFLVLAAMPFLFYYGVLRFNYPSLSSYPVQGLDVSHHQGVINWSKIDTTQFQFVFIKASEGESFVDKRFLNNWQAAQKQGLQVGAYHFFTFCKTGAVQAKNFINVVPKQATALPPVIDLEYDGNCSKNKSKAQLLHEIQAMEAILFQHYQKKPIFYVTENFYNDYLIGQFLNNPLWYRNIYNKPSIKDNRSWLFWQFSNRGKVEGINGFVDLNVFAFSQTQFNNL